MDILTQINATLDRATQDFDGKDDILRAAAEEIRQLRLQPTWFADVTIGVHDLQAFGTTPEHAISVLVSTWNNHAAREDVDVNLLARYRDSISVNPIASGKGYAKGIGGAYWYSGGFTGSDERFDSLIVEQPTVSGPAL